MRAPIACVWLIACATLFPPQNAAGEEPSRRIVPVRGSPNAVGGATRARYNPSVPPKRNVRVPSISAPSQPPAIVRPERPLNAQPARKGGKPAPVESPLPVGHAVESFGEIAPTVTADSDIFDTTPVELDQGAFLLPIWSPGFWAMPPGGLTRYLIPSRSFVNPDQTLMGAPLSVDEFNRATN